MTAGSITATFAQDATLVRLRGEIDAALRPQASAVMSGSLHRRRPIVLDTSEVTFIDPAGMAFLIQCSRFGHAEGLPVRLEACAPCVQELLHLVDADRLFDEPSTD